MHIATLLVFTFGCFISLASASNDSLINTDDPIEEEASIRALINKCENDPLSRSYLMELSDRFLEAYRRAERVTDLSINVKLAKGAERDVSRIACDRASIRSVLQERDASVTPILGRASPIAPAPPPDENLSNTPASPNNTQHEQHHPGTGIPATR